MTDPRQKKSLPEQFAPILEALAGLNPRHAAQMSHYLSAFAMLDDVRKSYIEFFVRHSTREILAFLTEGTLPDWLPEELRLTEEQLKEKLDDDLN